MNGSHEFGLLAHRCRGDVGVVLTPAKLNLFLEVTGRRSDGFHDLETLMVPLNWRDRLRFAVRRGAEDRLTVVGGDAPTGPENLVRRALDALRRECQIPALEIELHKRLPSEAGLGGGSGNAAGALVLANTMFELGLPSARLQDLAAELGSDVPFFMGSGPAVCTGRGEIVTPYSEWSRREGEGQPLFGGRVPFFVILVPTAGCATASVFGRLALPLTSPDGPISFPTTTFGNESRWVAGVFNRLESCAIVSEGRETTTHPASPSEAPTDRAKTQRATTQSTGGHSNDQSPLRDVADWLRREAAHLWPGLESPTRNWALTGSGSAFFACARRFVDARAFADRARDELGVGALALRLLSATDD